MKKLWTRLAIFTALAAVFAATVPVAYDEAAAQQPTAVPNSGAYITVITEEPVINIRMGPSSTIYPVVGKLPRGATAPALGRSPGGDWVQIEFPGAPNNVGWVYSPLVEVSPPAVILRIVEPPPTPIPPPTATIDPTFTAQFTTVPTQPRLPTFTPPPALVLPSYTQAPPAGRTPIPLAAIIIALAALGLVSFTLSLFSRR